MDIMTKVRVLWEKLAGLETKEEATAATLAGILPRIPKDYSTEEVNTGQKWINGKDIYRVVKLGNIGEITQATTIELNVDVDNLITASGTISTDSYDNDINSYTSSSRYSCVRKIKATSKLGLWVTSAYSLSDYIVIATYTKPDPVPAQLDKGTGMITGEDPEPETKKRKTKKEEK